jgi:hypothetical protein
MLLPAEFILSEGPENATKHGNFIMSPLLLTAAGVAPIGFYPCSSAFICGLGFSAFS